MQYRQLVVQQQIQSFILYYLFYFYKQIILQRGLPFDVKLPSSRPVDMSALSESELNAELEKGYADIKTGRTKEAGAVFADIRKDYNL